jgi:CelD/BcsL family acetyltransferase involved in cellulose biosynthesis
MERKQFEMVSTAIRLSEIKEEWQDLWTNSNGSYFHDHDYCWRSWISIHEPQGRSLRVLTLRDNGALIAVLPMVCYWKGLWKITKSLGPNAAEGCDILTRQGRIHGPSTVSAIWSEFLKQVRPHFIDLPYVKRGSMLEIAITSATNSRILEASEHHTPYASLREEVDWNSYRSSLSKGYRSQVARQRRKISEQGLLTAECATEGKFSYASWLLENKRHWAEKTKSRGTRGAWLYSQYYRDFLCILAEHGQHVLTFALKLDETPISVKIAVIGPMFCSLVIGSYDEKYAKYSPGTVLDEFWMQYVFENFRSRDGYHLDVDFGPGEELYKMHWSRDNILVTKKFLIATSRWGEAPRHIRTALDKLKAAADRVRPPQFSDRG